MSRYTSDVTALNFESFAEQLNSTSSASKAYPTNPALFSKQDMFFKDFFRLSHKAIAVLEIREAVLEILI